ncbi:HypA protein [Xylariomycetidae sp. FL2044]|nr:HypA protein [Xylariomycetidae sp. FL2044]
MATAHAVHITPDNTGLWQVRQTEPAAQKVTELLQKDLEKHHVFFNNDGFHNHLSHHVLALYGTGAGPEDIEKGYQDNLSYQRPALSQHENLYEELKDWEKAKKRLGKEQYYSDFLHFYQTEIDAMGWEKVLAEYMFKGDERSEDMLIRMFAGVVHPIIQLMYGVEWRQPAIVAMALAQASVHQDNLRDFFLAAEEEEKAARSATSASMPMPSIASLLDAVRADEKLARSALVDKVNKVRDGVLANARDEMVRIAGQVRVLPEELDARTAEMYNTAICEGAAAAVFPGKYPKFDFFLMHHINVSPIFVAFNKQDWISTANKARLLEWKIRLDLVEYAARACPSLSLDKITSYVPRDAEGTRSLTDLLPRVHKLEDDGHVPKLLRAIVVCRDLCRPYEEDEDEDNGSRDRIKIKGDATWDKIGSILIDAVETGGPRWVRNAGNPEAWKPEEVSSLTLPASETRVLETALTIRIVADSSVA